MPLEGHVRVSYETDKMLVVPHRLVPSAKPNRDHVQFCLNKFKNIADIKIGIERTNLLHCWSQTSACPACGCRSTLLIGSETRTKRGRSKSSAVKCITSDTKDHHGSQRPDAELILGNPVVRSTGEVSFREGYWVRRFACATRANGLTVCDGFGLRVPFRFHQGRVTTVASLQQCPLGAHIPDAGHENSS